LLLALADVVVFDGVFAYRDFMKASELYQNRPKNQVC
jgi:hypothetical protein